MTYQEMSPNVCGYTDLGQPIPFVCSCGEDGCYGRNGKWYCPICWYALQSVVRVDLGGGVIATYD